MSKEQPTNTPEQEEIIAKPGGVFERSLDEVMDLSMLPYSEHVILDRALPRVEDGLKPVQRRILYSMLGLGLEPDKPFKKSARIVGECLGKYHPHGDTSVYDAMVRMAQTHNMSGILVEGHGNFGSIDGDCAAAMRYTEARLAPLAMELLRDLEKDTVKWNFNFDDTLKEPDTLPGRFPNLLVNGAYGIAVGLATNIPPHNLGEVIDGTIAYMENPKITLKEIMKYIKGPDFPTGAAITTDELEQAYQTGKGKIMMHAVYHIETTAGDKKNIVITEMPYQVNKAKLLQSIVALKDTKRGVLDGIADVRDESDRNGMRAVITVKKDGNLNAIIETLLKSTDLRCSFPINMVAIADGKPRTLPLLDIIKYYVEYQKKIIVRRSQYDLNVAKERSHILEGLLIAIKNIDEVIKIIKTSSSPIEAKMKLKERFVLSDRQAQAILDMRLARLTHLEVNSLKEELDQLKLRIAELEAIIKSEILQIKIIKDELLDIKKRNKVPRRTEIIGDKHKEIAAAVIVDTAPSEMVLGITVEGNVKLMEKKHYDNANKDFEDGSSLNTAHKQILKVKTDQKLLAFTNKGYMLSFTASELQRQDKFKDKGTTPREAFLDFSLDEKIVKIIPADFTKEKDILFFTSQGYVKKTNFKEYDLQKAYVQAVKLRDDVDNDELINVEFDDSNKDMIFVTHEGQVLYAKKDDVPLQGRVSGGVHGIKLDGKDYVVYADLTTDEGELCIITNNAFAKRVIIPQIDILPRYRKGVKITTLGKGDSIKFAVTCTNPLNLVINTTEGTFVKNTDKVSIEDRVAKGKAIIKTKDEFSVYINNTTK